MPTEEVMRAGKAATTNAQTAGPAARPSFGVGDKQPADTGAAGDDRGGRPIPTTGAVGHPRAGRQRYPA
eukprot:1863993-Alexandrium_andersonii.AAC.1